MHTPITNHTFTGNRGPEEADAADALAAPAVIVAGTRLSRELIRLFVAGAFVALEAVFRVGEMRVARVFDRKRPT